MPCIPPQYSLTHTWSSRVPTAMCLLVNGLIWPCTLFSRTHQALCSGSLQAAPVCFPHLLLLWPHGSETSVPKLVAYPHPLPASIDRLVRVSTPEGSTQSLLNPSLEKQTLCLPRSREIPFTKPTPPSLACQSPYPIIKGKLPVLRQQTLQVSHLDFS